MEKVRPDVQMPETDPVDIESISLGALEVPVDAIPAEQSLLESQKSQVEHSPHHWVIPTNGETVVGCCKDCGAEKEFKNGFKYPHDPKASSRFPRFSDNTDAAIIHRLQVEERRRLEKELKISSDNTLKY